MWLLFTNRSQGASQPFAVQLRAGAVVVGRGGEADVVVADRYLSQRHVELLLKGAEVTFRDLGSSTGCSVDGREARAGVLAPGARLVVGRTEIQVQAAPPQFSALAPAKTAAVEADGASARPGGGADWLPFRSLVDRLLHSAHPRDLLERLLQGLVELIRAERGFVLLEEQPGGRLVPVASHQLADPDSFATVSSTVYKQALEAGRVIHVVDSLADRSCSAAKSLVEDGVARTVVCAPLGAAGEQFGVIYLDRPVGGEPVGAAQLQMVETFTGLASELVAGQRTRETLISAQGRIDALANLVCGDEKLVLGDGDASLETQRLIRMAGEQDVTVLVTGETGTGKEMVARALHQLSARRHGPFIPVNCAALPPDLMEAELFGAERGSFTGATERRIGRFELATGGTLFLDEVGELPSSVQVKLLRVIQERSIQRLGGTQPIPLDFRLVCATNRDLERAVMDGTVRSDFFYRINVFRIHLRPLAQRPEDIMPLARSFLERLVAQSGKKISGFSPEAERLMLSYLWPGNVREMRNAIERAVVLEQSDTIKPGSLPLARVAPAEGPLDLMAEQRVVGGLPAHYEPAKEIFDRAFLRRAFELYGGNITAIARETGLTRPTVYKWRIKLGLGGGEDQGA